MKDQLIDILKKNGVTELTIADIGSKGNLDFINELSKITSIYGFEPNPEEHKKLEITYKHHPFKSLRLNQTGLGEKEGAALFNITKHASMSSLLEADMDNYEKHFGSYREFGRWKDYIHTTEHISIDLDTADHYFKNNPIDYLKIDTQGSELSILKGATKLLMNKKIQIIKVEVSTIPVYKEQALFSDIDLFLRNYNYTLVDFVTYRNDHTSIWNQEKAHAHYAPCGDAIYALEDDTAGKDIFVKKATLLHWLGYPGIADSYFRKAGLSEKDVSTLKSIKNIKHKPLHTRLLKNIIPPILYKLIERIG